MNLKSWFHQHSLKLLAIRDTPDAIAGGVAIGVFFGFTPLFGLKTLSAIFFAWLTRSNILAAVIAGALHDIILPFMPVIYRWEYDVGYFLLSRPHQWPVSLAKLHREGFDWHNWHAFFGDVGKPLLLGGCVCAAPFAILAYFLTRRIVARHQLKKQTRTRITGEEANPS
jgi:uncharacterized protein (DUF2062 family)